VRKAAGTPHAAGVTAAGAVIKPQKHPVRLPAAGRAGPVLHNTCERTAARLGCQLAAGLTGSTRPARPAERGAIMRMGSVELQMPAASACDRQPAGMSCRRGGRWGVWKHGRREQSRHTVPAELAQRCMEGCTVHQSAAERSSSAQRGQVVGKSIVRRIPSYKSPR